MPLVLWAKTAVGPNLPFLKGFGKAVKSWKDVLQQFVLRKPAKLKIQTFDISRVEAKDRCLLYPNVTQNNNSSIQSRIFRSFFSRTSSQTLARELRRRSALKLTSSSSRSFRHVPIMSLIGVTLGLDISGVIDEGAEKMMSEMRDMFRGYKWDTDPPEKLPHSLNDLDINLESIANGCEGAVYKAKMKADAAKLADVVPIDADFDLAVKAVFNYGAESNAQSILRELEREIVPLRVESCQLDSELCKRVNHLPPHPHIVDMPGIFVDDMLVTEEGLRKFPAAMPHKLDPEKYFGRNKTLYLVMRRRSTHLRDYLATHDVTMATRCLMLAQVLEGVSHLQKHGIAHRDLKTDNILVEVPKPGGSPRLEICDFGCCLAEENKNMQVPYTSRDVYMGGNSWLMAPELVTAMPGPNNVLDFRKSDLWAVGAIAYEILGTDNPFYPCRDNSRKQMRNVDYIVGHLPSLPDDVPVPIKRLVKALLSRDPNKRPSANTATAVAQMVALELNGTPPSPPKPPTSAVKKEVRPTAKKLGRKPGSKLFVTKEQKKLYWIVVQSFSLLCQLTLGNQSDGWDVVSATSFLLLSRLTYSSFKEAMKFF
ncbi:unnamed protein product [Lymnaea stagnalis]|uniref:non-specific serine/threonine protein kinase n=1 Tax=Lymnaea stagnalis TaxID=6523 RepID=A0AAV2HR98_LYMST